MPTRRAFLESLAAAALAVASPAFAGEKETHEIDINTSLRKIAHVLRSDPINATVDEHVIDDPTGALVQWRWMHFYTLIKSTEIPRLERVNAELFDAMQHVNAMPDAILDALMHEGFLCGDVPKNIQEYQKTHRKLIATQFRIVVPFGAAPDILPDTEKVEREMNRIENLRRPVSQIIRFNDGSTRNVHMSPLARLGAGYVLTTQSNMKLMACEDAVIDVNAEKAAWSDNKEDFKRWVMKERETHFVKLVRESKRKINHLILGYWHDLVDDVTQSNTNHDEKLSHIVVTMPGLKGAPTP